MSKRTNFNVAWKLDPLFKTWVTEDPVSKGNFRCSLCHVTLELSNMGRNALVKHSKSKKHQQNFETSKSASAAMLTSWTRVRTKPNSAGDQEVKDGSSVNDCDTTSNRSIARSADTTLPGPSHGGAVSERGSVFEAWGIRDDVLKAEALWTIHSVINHHSFNSNANTSALFEVMFPDSPMAKQFSCGANKMSYLASFGIAPFFTEELYDSLSNAHYYSVSFDESLNTTTKNEQLDVAVRYFDVESSRTVDRYLNSQFLGHSTAENLLKSFMEATCRLEMKKTIHVSLDGPAVNHKFLRLLQAERKKGQ